MELRARRWNQIKDGRIEMIDRRMQVESSSSSVGSPVSSIVQLHTLRLIVQLLKFRAVKIRMQTVSFIVIPHDFFFFFGL